MGSRVHFVLFLHVHANPPVQKILVYGNRFARNCALEWKSICNQILWVQYNRKCWHIAALLSIECSQHFRIRMGSGCVLVHKRYSNSNQLSTIVATLWGPGAAGVHHDTLRFIRCVELFVQSTKNRYVLNTPVLDCTWQGSLLIIHIILIWSMWDLLCKWYNRTTNGLVMNTPNRLFFLSTQRLDYYLD